ncbi:MAG: AAA family ATPase [Candidatus Omnitrophica bacterium]|nr:AAA family ATPase [Candidatus Omnitrophota bacterium]
MCPVDTRHFLFLKELVRLEEQEENEEIKNEFLGLSPQERESRGKALLGLALEERHFSPAGHILATFRLRSGKALPLFSLDVGDIVSLVAEPKFSGEDRKARGEFPAGTVYEKTGRTLTVAFHEKLPDWLEVPSTERPDPTYQLHRSLNRVTYKRMLEALDAVTETRATRLAVFREISLGARDPRALPGPRSLEWFDRTLNDSQKESVRRALAAEDIFLVHGPPGTGKTTALLEIIRQAARKGQSVFATAPSNTACDNILERLVEKGIHALRLGHPARITVSLREHTLDFKLALHPLAKEINRVQAELERLTKKETRRRERYGRRRGDGEGSMREIAGARGEIASLRRDVFVRVLKESQVIVGTPASIQDRAVRDRAFDLLVMDEATQATEPLSWIPMARVNKVVMAGDHFQLPPTVRSKEAEEKGLGVTLFERLYDTLEEKNRLLLERQYRMHEAIMGFSSREFYGNLLVADESVKHRTLADLPGVARCADTEAPVLFIDTAGKGFSETLEAGSESRYNAGEAALLLEELGKMLRCGVPPAQIAVISPYSAQVRFLASQSPDAGIEIDSVDGFQGREKELVMVSLVRSNLEGDLGFLTDTRRMNVAMTRAKRKLLVIGDGGTLASLPFYRDFIRYTQEIGGYKTVWERDEGGK